MNQAEGLWVMDQLWKHVGMMIHHLPQKDKNRIMSTCIFLNVRLLYSLFFCPVGQILILLIITVKSSGLHVLGGQEAFQVTGQEENDLICFGGRSIAGTDLQDAPACAGQGIVEKPICIPVFFQHPLLQQDSLVLGVPINSGCCRS